MSGQIVDASLIAAPRQLSTVEEKQAIKEGRIPDEWKDKPAKPRQKDREARWTVKFTKAKPREDGSLPRVDIAIPVFGYQNHISIDAEFRQIRRWSATDAAAYEGARLREGLLDKTNTASGVGLGRHGVPFEDQRGVSGEERLRQSRPSQEAEGQANAGGDATGQQRQIQNPLQGRTRLRRAEGSAGPVYPHRRNCTSDDKNRDGEPCLQS